MSRGLNKVQLIGNLGDDPEFITTQSGTNIATLRVATSEQWKDKDGNQQERTEWHRVKFFGRVAEVCRDYLRKGSKIYVEGKIRTEKWTDNDNVDRYSTDIIGDDMQMLGGADAGSNTGERPQRNQQASGQNQQRTSGQSQQPRSNGNGNGGGQQQRGNGNGGGNGDYQSRSNGGGYQQSNQPSAGHQQHRGAASGDGDIPF